MPTTRCTSCQTVFELPSELLSSSDTRVRCGECLCIFDAREGLITPDAKSAGKSQAAELQVRSGARRSKAKKKNRGGKSRLPAAVQLGGDDDQSALDVTYSDFDLFSEDADLPALAYLDETRDTPEFDFDAIELGDDENFSDTMFSHDVTINADLPIGAADPGIVGDRAANLKRAEVDFSVDKTPEEPLIFNYEDPPASTEQETASSASDVVTSNVETGEAQDAGLDHDAIDSGADAEGVLADPLGQHLDTPPKRRHSAWMWGICVLMLIGVLIATVVYPRWHTLDQSPTFRPMKVALCEAVGCRVDTRVDIDNLRVLRREVFESSERDNALLISIKIQNTADFAQRYPVVEVRMTNRIGRTVAQRGFRPADYLPEWSRGDALGASESVDISLTVNDPGTAAEDHVLQLRELRLDCAPLSSVDGRQRWPADCAEL